MTIGINSYDEQDYQQFIQKMLDLPQEEEYPEAFNRDHEDFRPNGALGHIYNADIIQASAHDWVSSHTRRTDGTVRAEYYEGEIQARSESIAFDEDLELDDNQSVCAWCHLTTLAQTKCINCDEYVS